MIKEHEKLLRAIQSEGFDFALVEYSDWKNIKDAKFQRLLRKFRDAREYLMDYIEDEMRIRIDEVAGQ